MDKESSLSVSGDTVRCNKTRVSWRATCTPRGHHSRVWMSCCTLFATLARWAYLADPVQASVCVFVNYLHHQLGHVVTNDHIFTLSWDQRDMKDTVMKRGYSCWPKNDMTWSYQTHELLVVCVLPLINSGMSVRKPVTCMVRTGICTQYTSHKGAIQRWYRSSMRTRRSR